ncbi:uncharacterized protein [Lolium perenne]|uniref:uncharacterized protein n=1 Tax=Lolium perenne TaxID=4522 RepID=UPI0021F63A71|nr:uncharacterized protein LOC127339024 [Lolium perenne]
MKENERESSRKKKTRKKRKKTSCAGRSRLRPSPPTRRRHGREEAQVLGEAAQGKRRRSGAAKRHQAEEEASSSISAKILREALKQQHEEEGLPEQLPSDAPAAASFVPIPVDDEEDVDEFDGFDAQSEYDGGVPEIDEEDEKALAAFMSKDDTSSKQSLGDIILQKIRDKDATVSTGGHQSTLNNIPHSYLMLVNSSSMSIMAPT